MGQLKNILSAHQHPVKRDVLARMNDDKVACMRRAQEFGPDYWDGEKRYGYGGFRYLAGRWKPVAQALIDVYELKAGSRVLDIGCGKAFLLYEMQMIEPGLDLVGVDVSRYALDSALPEFRGRLLEHDAKNPLPFDSKAFDLVLSLSCLHSLRNYELHKALAEIERVGKRAYISVESYRDDMEMFNLQCWALTCRSFYCTEEWVWLFGQFGYTGDFEFLFF